MQNNRLIELLKEIDNWLVCSCIATPEDMAQSFEPFHLAIEKALQAVVPADPQPVAVVKENPFCPDGKSDEISEYLPVGTQLYAAPTPEPGSIGAALRSCDWSGVSIGNKAIIEAAARALSSGAPLPTTINVTELTFSQPVLAADALERLLALEPNAENLKRWQALQSEPRRKLEIEEGLGGAYDAWLTDSDGNLHTIAAYAHPMATADWCERNGFAWEVIGLKGDPLVALARWRAGK